MKITRRQLRRLILEEIQHVRESYADYDSDADGVVDWDEVPRFVKDMTKSQPLVKPGGRHERIPGYHWDDIGVHVRDDYNPRTDYGDELEKAVSQLQTQELGRV